MLTEHLISNILFETNIETEQPPFYTMHHHLHFSDVNHHLHHNIHKTEYKKQNNQSTYTTNLDFYHNYNNQPWRITIHTEHSITNRTWTGIKHSIYEAVNNANVKWRTSNIAAQTSCTIFEIAYFKILNKNDKELFLVQLDQTAFQN